MDINESVEGETIENQISRLINDGGTIDSEKIPIYTKPSENVLYGTDIRGDKWDKAIEVNEKINENIDKIRKMKVVKNNEKEDVKDTPKEENGANEKSV